MDKDKTTTTKKTEIQRRLFLAMLKLTKNILEPRYFLDIKMCDVVQKF